MNETIEAALMRAGHQINQLQRENSELRANLELQQRSYERKIELEVAAERERWRDAINALADSWDDPAEAYGMRLALNEGLKAQRDR